MKKIPDYTKSAKALKKLGLIDFSIRTLSPAQKGTITKLVKKYKAILKHPKDFVIRPVSKKTNDVAKKSGYLGNKKSIFLPKHDAEKVSINNNKITYQRKGKKEEVFLIGDIKAFYKKANFLQSKLKKNQLVTFKYGQNAASNYSFNSLEELRKYLTEVLEPRFKEKNMFSQISIVTLERPKILGKRVETVTERKTREKRENNLKRK